MKLRVIWVWKCQKLWLKIRVKVRKMNLYLVWSFRKSTWMIRQKFFFSIKVNLNLEIVHEVINIARKIPFLGEGQNYFLLSLILRKQRNSIIGYKLRLLIICMEREKKKGKGVTCEVLEEYVPHENVFGRMPLWRETYHREDLCESVGEYQFLISETRYEIRNMTSIN